MLQYATEVIFFKVEQKTIFFITFTFLPCVCIRIYLDLSPYLQGPRPGASPSYLSEAFKIRA